MRKVNIDNNLSEERSIKCKRIHHLLLNLPHHVLDYTIRLKVE
uniref:Bm218 n=1 Tax=Brugia malayi TaxID=6279 RepID=A0A1I9G058_BRUMA|nr:Bm218 [Brugia malayi]